MPLILRSIQRPVRRRRRPAQTAMGSIGAELYGRTALVVGGAHGIGRDIALDLAASGARVAIVSSSRGQADKASRAIEDAGGMAWPFPADITDVRTLPALVRKVGWRLGPVDVLVSTALAASPQPLVPSADSAELTETLDLNVAAVLALTSAVLPGMLDRGWGRIASVLDGPTQRPATMTGNTFYGMSRAAADAVTATLALELAGKGVTVNVYQVSPATAACRAHGTWPSAKSCARRLVSLITGDHNGGAWDLCSDGLNPAPVPGDPAG
jgi:3-oxoacyl-[acyl-carrier protein] reductase